MSLPHLITIGELVMGHKPIAVSVGVEYVIGMNADRSMLTKVVRGLIGA